MSFPRIADKVLSGRRLTAAEGRRLFRHANLPELGVLADIVRCRLHPEPVVTYVLGRNVNYTNVCWVQCGFCNFHRRRGDPDAYVLPEDLIHQKVAELVEAGGTELLMQGGLHPELKLDYFENLLRGLKQRFPVHLHSLSATEVLHLARRSRVSVREALQRLRAAGLDSLPGAGAEILVDEVRQVISPRKESAAEWFSVHRLAHELGMNTTATMMYGSIETVEQRVEHLLRVREVQDEALARGSGGGRFLAFIPWSFQPRGTRIQRQGIFPGEKASGYDYLRTVAVSRMMLDNIDNVQASWVTQGVRIAQLSLRYGVNDFGSTMMEENVVSQAGACFQTSAEEIERLIRGAGYTPRVRNTRYEILGTLEEVRHAARMRTGAAEASRRTASASRPVSL